MSKKAIKDDNIAGRIQTLEEQITKGKNAQIEARFLFEDIKKYGICWLLKGSSNPKNLQKLFDRLERIVQNKFKTVPIPFLTGK